MSTPKTMDYAKLTVPQLKALCKDRKISGYSKLSKLALLQKLAGDDNTCVAPVLLLPEIEGPGKGQQTATNARTSSSLPPVSSQASRTLSGAGKESMHSSRGHTTNPIPKITNLSNGSDIHGLHAFSDPARSPGLPFAEGPVPTICATNCDLLLAHPSLNPENNKTFCSETAPAPAAAPGPRKRSADAFKTPPAKRAKTKDVSASASRLGPPCSSGKPILKCPAAVPKDPVSKTTPLGPASSHRTNGAADRASPTVAPQPKTAKRFKPLISTQKPTSAHPNQDVKVASGLPETQPSWVAQATGLAFPVSRFGLPLGPISLPPSLSQRKHVQGWAVILSGLDDRGRAACSLVSRMFRYAVYLSAGPILRRNYGGRRLVEDTTQYSQAMTNFWPYLRFRDDEAAQRRHAYERSFLSRLAGDGKANGIAPRLWGSPDNEKQITIAVRFLLSSLWFALSIGGTGSEEWLQGTVVDTHEVVKGEIWTVTIRHASGTPSEATFYVIEQTCEVIGRPAATTLPNSASGLELRADWSAYMNVRIGRDTPDGDFSLLGHLKWAHHEEYERGISKIWQKRIKGEGALGEAKRVVAERYVLACVVANSVSGVWMSTTQMAQEFAGLPDRQAAPVQKTTHRGSPINLYLPAHHHIESVHFMTSSKASLHPALAVVQTQAREYFVLRDNGMQVGSEEEGVAPLWMEVLGCNYLGIAV